MSINKFNYFYTGYKPSELYDRATGYGIVRFNKKTRDITIECWPRQANPETDTQYPGWPVKINQLDNFLKNAKLFLPTLEISGINHPVIQVMDETNDEVVLTLRINGNSFRPKVLKDGYYSIKIGEPGKGKEKILDHIIAVREADQETIMRK